MGNGTQWHKGAAEDGAPWGNWVQRGIGDRGVVGNEKKDAVENRVRSAGGGTRRGEVEEQDTMREHYLGCVFDVACVLFFLFSMWCWWGVRRLDALLAPDVRALAVPLFKCERIKMPKRGGGELGFSKNLSNL